MAWQGDFEPDENAEPMVPGRVRYFIYVLLAVLFAVQYL